MKAVTAACESDANERGLRVAIAVVDDGGHLTLLHHDEVAKMTEACVGRFTIALSSG